MIFLVVLVHSGGVYENSGIWAFFWIVDDPSTNTLAGELNLILDIFIMSVIFFVSGYLVLPSIKSKSSLTFIKTKIKRLLFPWFLAVFTLIPLYKVIFLYSRNMPQQNWATYFHFTNGIFSQNWLWFLPVLFAFDIIILGLSKIHLSLPKIGLKTAVGILFFLGLIFSFSMDIFDLQGWTKTFIMDFQNERILIYFMIFLLGIFCYNLKVFDTYSKSRKLYITLLILIWIPIYSYRLFYIQSFVFPGVYIFNEIADKLIMWISFHLTLLSLLYLSVSSFRYYFNRQGNLISELNKNSYNVYIIHTIILGGIALILLNTSLPSLLKYFLLVASTFILSNIVISIYRKMKLKIQLQKG